MPETQSPDIKPKPVETVAATENAANDTRTITESAVNDTSTVTESASDAPPMPTFRLFPPLPSPEEQIETIAAVNAEERRAEAAQIGMDIPGLTVPEDAIGRALSGGSGKKQSVERIIAFFQTNPDAERAAAFLEKEFGEAYRGVTIDGKKYALGFDGEGFHIAQGDSVRVTDATVVSWRQAADMASGLLRDGKFASQKQIDAARPNEFRELSESLWYVRQNFSEEATAAGYLRSIEDAYQAHGFPEGTLQIAELLKNPEQRAKITAELREYAAACEKNADLRRFSRISSPSEALARLELADSPLTEFHATANLEAVKGSFITRDEIDALFRESAVVHDGKMRIFSYFAQGHDAKERADFLKDEYGVSGYYSNEYSASYDSKGIKFKREDEYSGFDGYDTVFLNWSQAARRIGQLIEAGAYLNDKETAYKPRYELLQLARSVQTFRYYSADNAVWNPQDAEKRIIPLLENPEKSAELYQEMARTMENTPLSNANYRAMKKALRDMEAYQKGEYSLFTPLSEEALEEERAERAARKLAEKQEREDFDEYDEAEESEELPDDGNEAEAGTGGLAAAARRLARKSRTSAKEQDNGQFSFFGEEEQDGLSETSAPEISVTTEEAAVMETDAAPEKVTEVSQSQTENSALRQVDYRLVQENDGNFILFEEKARRAAKLLNLPLTTREVNGDGPLDVCEIPADRLDEAVEKLRRGYSIAVHELGENGRLKPPRIFDALEAVPEQEANAPDNAGQEAQQLLSRLVADCVFFLEDPEHSTAQLWAGNVEAQVAKMRELYAQFPESSNWIAESEIEEYARQMEEVLAEKATESVAEPSERSEAVTEEATDDNVAVTPEQSEADAPGKQYELGYGYLGNGLTVWNRLEEERGDYKTVAHIDPERSVTFYDADMPENVRAAIIREAATSELPDAPAFSVPPIAPEQAAVKTAHSADKKTPDDNVAAISESVAESAEPQSLLLIQNGDFFELFGEDAEIAAPILGLALGHTTDGEGGSLTFCGFPVEQLQAALEKLTQKYSVKLSDKNGVREFPYVVPSVSEQAQHERDSVTRTANDNTNGNATESVSEANAPATETETNAPTVQETAENAPLQAKTDASAEDAENSDNAPRAEAAQKNDAQKESVEEAQPVTEIKHTTGEKNPYPEISGDVPRQGRRVVTMEDADAALRLWNANLTSKVEAMRYIRAHGQEPDAAAWLAHEYGDMDATPRIFTFPGAEQDLTLTWDEIKVRLSELIREGAFVTPEEMDILNPDRLTGLRFQDALVKAMTERPYTESVTRGGLRYAVGGKIGAELNVSGGVMKASLVIKDITDASVVYALADAPTVRRVRMERGRFEKLLDSGRFYLREQPQRDEKSQTAPAKKGQGRSRPESNYRTFAQLFPEIASSEYRYLRMKVNGETGHMPLNVEWIDNDEIALSHTYTQNGDLMYDPEMTFRVDKDAGTLEALTYRQDNAGLYQEVYQSPTVWSPRLRSDLNNFARTWLKNISDTPYVKDYAITERNGNDKRIDFDNKGNPIPETSPEQEAAAPESVQETESSAPEQVSETITESAAQEIETPSNVDSVPQDKPAYQGVPPEFLPYKKGDTVYLWKMSFQVHEIGTDYVELSNPISGGSRKFHYHKENRAKFERELPKDERNRAICDFLPANPEDVGMELRDVLVSGSGLLQAKDKEAISGVLRDGKSNSEIASKIAWTYAGVWNSVRMANGEQAEFSGTLNGLYVNILGQNGRSLSFDWNAVVSVLRGMWQRGEYGFSVEPKAPETAKDNPIETSPERNANALERSETVTENTPPVKKEASAPESASADAPKRERRQSEATENERWPTN